MTSPRQRSGAPRAGRTGRSRLEEPLDPRRPVILILGDDRDDEDHDVLFPALRRRGVEVVRVHPFDLVIHLGPAGAGFAVHGRAISPDLVVGWVFEDLLLPGMTALDVMAGAGIPVINDALTLLRAGNKLLDSARRASAGLLSEPMISGYDRPALAGWLEQLDAPAVVKPLHGYGGSGIARIDSAADLPAAGARDDAFPSPFCAMPWIENPGRDIRVYTVNHHPVLAMYRYAPEGGWITNVKAGGTIAVCPLSTELAELAARASRAAGTLIGGIDIGEDLATGGYVVYEVNSCPSCEPPVLEMVADFLAEVALRPETAQETWVPSTVHADPAPGPGLFHPSKRHLVRPADPT